MKRSYKTVYSLAAELKVGHKKLLYALHKIGFPIAKTSKGRHADWITNINLFNALLPTIRTLWRYEYNNKRWITSLKGLGWKKDRISHFMKRRVARGLVPKAYFDIVPPNAKNIKAVLRAKKQRINFPENIWELADPKIATRKEMYCGIRMAMSS
jgi:hypothetical protein